MSTPERDPALYEPETNPNVKWYQRGGLTTIAMIGLVLGIVCWLAIAGGAVFGDFSLVRGFVPFPAVIGLMFSLVGFIGPWKMVAAIAFVLNLGAGAVIFFL